MQKGFPIKIRRNFENIALSLEDYYLLLWNRIRRKIEEIALNMSWDLISRARLRRNYFELYGQ